MIFHIHSTEASESVSEYEGNTGDRLKYETNGAFDDDNGDATIRPSNYISSDAIDPENYSFGLDHGKQTLNPEKIGSITEKCDECDSDTTPTDNSDLPEAPQVTVNPDQVLSGILSEYDSLNPNSSTEDSSAIDISVLKNCTYYRLMIQGLNSLEDPLTPVISLLEQSSGNERGEYVLAAILEDVSGISFNDDNGRPVWTSGKEYLALYKQAVSKN